LSADDRGRRPPPGNRARQSAVPVHLRQCEGREQEVRREECIVACGQTLRAEQSRIRRGRGFVPPARTPNWLQRGSRVVVTDKSSEFFEGTEAPTAVWRQALWHRR